MELKDLLIHEEIKTNAVNKTFEGENRVKDLELILHVVKTINKSLILEEVLQLVLDNAIKVAKAERGFLILLNEEGKLQCELARDEKGNSLPEDAYQVSETIVQDVFTSTESIFIENAQTDHRYEQRKSIQSLRLQTIICSPLVVRNEKIGIIYVDSRSIQSIQKDEIVDLFEILAGQAAIAIKNAQLYDKLQKAFQDVQIANDQLIKSDRMISRGKMASEISHELKNLVNVVLLQLQYFQSSISMNPKLGAAIENQRLKNSIASVQRIGEFAQGLLESAPMKLEKKPGNINEKIKQTVKYIRTLKKYQKAKLEISLDDNVPIFSFDEKQIHQVLLNLLNNAVEAYEEATIKIKTKYFPSKNIVQIVVSDNGPGIEKEVLNKLLVSKITTKPDGNGYGLPICRKIIENHGGTMEIESEVNKGTTFFMTLSAKSSDTKM